MTAIYRRNALGSIALAAGLVAAGFSGSALARSRAELHGSVQAKLEYCETCHGESGQGFYGYYAIPRLAGQQPGYLLNQLRDFTSGLRTHPIMGNVARGVAQPMYGAIAEHFHSMNSAAARRGRRQCCARAQDFHRGAAGIECAGLLGLSWSRRPRRAGNSPSRRPVAGLSRKDHGELGSRALRQIGGRPFVADGADHPQPDPRADRGGRRLCQRLAVRRFVPADAGSVPGFV